MEWCVLIRHPAARVNGIAGSQKAGTLYSAVAIPHERTMPAISPADLVRYEERILQALRELGLPESLAKTRRQSVQLECESVNLVSIGLDLLGREQRLERRAAEQWSAMQAATEGERVVLGVISGFRSFDYQCAIIARKLAAGQSTEQILAVSALPGFSEHHSGRAVDVGTPGCPHLTEEFERTPAFSWLTRHAAEHGFQLSYPRGNSLGIAFEPWHWLFGRNDAIGVAHETHE
jgi:D-alanyl-D-alanine carboxypeptidase